VRTLARARSRRALPRLRPAVTEGVKIEADLSTLAVETQALVEGMTAFSEKRQPVFGDR